MLDRQYHLYSIDTGYFYSNHEKSLHDRYHKYRREYMELQSRLPKLEKNLKQAGCAEADISKLRKGITEETAIMDSCSGAVSEYLLCLGFIKHKKEKAKRSKEALTALLSHKAAQNELSKGRDHIRAVRENSINDTNVVSVFESALSRAIGIRPDELTKALITVQIYYLEIFKDISFYGFTFQGERYRYFTSSAGQIRTRKAMFIKETVWSAIEKNIMCGLTIERINAKGGNNVNKHLAYMALTNTATDEWQEFDIDRSIVIDDFETDVYGTFDFVNETDYSIERKTGQVPIPHTDGAGMMLPSVSAKNFMFRAPWIKGLLGVFDFRRFVEANHCSPVITDIYGREHDIIREDIRIIFTRSQFKMYKYYDSWDEYKEAFQKHHCSACICNVEEDRITNAKLNYQVLQTLTDITEEEIGLLTRRSSERISGISASGEAMMELLGITPYNTNMTPFQKAVKLYPALLNDTYTKDMIRDIKNSLLKKYRSGKLEVTGKYTFLLPDFYAACEHWFGHIEHPEGLLADQEVYCRLFRRYDRLDCMRSPHLYKEHAVRRNTAHQAYGGRSGQLGQWFVTDALYTSSHDLISRILQFDVDGDRSLVVADSDFVRIAERNMKGIVPLYYNMRKAEPTALNSRTIYAGLTKAFTYGNIGLYSNDISKIWNHDVFTDGSPSEQQEAVDTVKLLCMENNFCIDAAKTLYMPERPEWFRPVVSKYSRDKLPAFFEYAKDKERSQLKKRNGSLVNRIYDRIPDPPVSTRGLKLDALDYRKLKSDGRIVCSREISDLYDRLNRQYRYMTNRKDEYIDNLHYIACKLRGEFSRSGYSEETITDMLVDYLYGGEKRYKQLLWFLYGQYIVNNLQNNLDIPKTKFIQCVDCDEWIEIRADNRRTCRCERCRQIHLKDYERTRKRQQRNKKA